MLILTIRTDKPEAEIGLYDSYEKLAYKTWHAHRELSVTLHQKVVELLAGQNADLEKIEGIICFAGPGSFTGLRIGLSVANALAYGLSVPIVSQKGARWITEGIVRLLQGEQDTLALPEYGAPVRITQQKK